MHSAGSPCNESVNDEKRLFSKHDHDFENNLFLSKSVTPASGIRQQQNIFLLQIQLLWNPHFRAPVCFCDLPLQPAAFGILPERNVPFKRIFPDFGFVDRKYIFLTRPFYCGQKMCLMPTARISSAISRSFTCSVTPQSTARSVCASTRSAAEMFLQPDKIAAVRVFGFWKIPSAVP